MPRTARVCGGPLIQLKARVFTGTETSTHVVPGIGCGPLCQLVKTNPGVRLTLVTAHVILSVEVGQPEGGTRGGHPGLISLKELNARDGTGVEFLGDRHKFSQLFRSSTDKEHPCFGIIEVPYGVSQHSVGLATTSSTTVQYFLLRCGQEVGLRTRVRLEDYFLCLLNLDLLWTRLSRYCRSLRHRLGCLLHRLCDVRFSRPFRAPPCTFRQGSGDLKLVSYVPAQV